MKIILTGPTGHIGSNVLKAALAHPAITSIIAFSRRQLPTSFPDPHNKLTVIVQSDFTRYSDETLEACAGAEACIWGMGVANMETGRTIIVDSTIAAAKAFVDAKVAGEGKKFRFVHLSGMFVEKDQTKRLWFMNEGRKIRVSIITFEFISYRENDILYRDTDCCTPLADMCNDTGRNRGRVDENGETAPRSSCRLHCKAGRCDGDKQLLSSTPRALGQVHQRR